MQSQDGAEGLAHRGGGEPAPDFVAHYATAQYEFDKLKKNGWMVVARIKRGIVGGRPLSKTTPYEKERILKECRKEYKRMKNCK